MTLTSEIGLVTAGHKVHRGVLQLGEPENEGATVHVIAKLAFQEDCQKKLFHETSMHTQMVAKGVRGVPPVLGVFGSVADDGPYIMILRDDGVSLQDRGRPISDKQK